MEKVLIKLNDNEFELRYDFNAFIAIEDGLKININKLYTVKMGLHNVRILIWAGILHQYPDIKERDIGRLMKITECKYYQDKFFEAFKLAIPPADEGDEKNPQSSTSEKSGQEQESESV